MLVVLLDKGADLTIEIGERIERAATNGLIGDQSEPAFHLIDPRTAGRREMQMKAWTTISRTFR